MFPDLERVQSTLRSLQTNRETEAFATLQEVWDRLKVRELLARAERDLHSDVQTLHIPDMSHAV